MWADDFTVPVRFQAVGSAPILRQKVFKVSASQKFETVVNFLRKKLECKPTDSVFLYVNSVFAPGLDEGVGNLYRVSRSSWAQSGSTPSSPSTSSFPADKNAVFQD
jgi:ubiquitin-like protein ATG12